MPSTDLQQALVGKHVTLPDGRHAVVRRDDISGAPAFVRNQLRRHQAAGTLLRIEQAIEYQQTRNGAAATCTVIVLGTGAEDTPSRPPVMRWTLTAAGGLCGAFGMAMIAGYATAAAFEQLLKGIAAGVTLCAFGGILLWLAVKVTTIGGGGGHHCPGCPDH